MNLGENHEYLSFEAYKQIVHYESRIIQNHSSVSLLAQNILKSLEISTNRKE